MGNENENLNVVRLLQIVINKILNLEMHIIDVMIGPRCSKISVSSPDPLNPEDRITETFSYIGNIRILDMSLERQSVLRSTCTTILNPEIDRCAKIFILPKDYHQNCPTGYLSRQLFICISLSRLETVIPRP